HGESLWLTACSVSAFFTPPSCLLRLPRTALVGVHHHLYPSQAATRRRSPDSISGRGRPPDSQHGPRAE
ncbi:hypothetical protein IRJ41_001050, partial [Triplophysa rosa]